jgi:hypothetical protein
VGIRCDTSYPQWLALTSPTRGGCLVGIVRLWTKDHGRKDKEEFSQQWKGCNIVRIHAKENRGEIIIEEFEFYEFHKNF